MMTYLLQSSICLLLFYTVYIVFFKQHTHHTFNRFYLLSSLLLSIIIPWIEITTAVETTALTTTIGRTIQANLEVEKSIYNTTNILLFIYFSGVLISSLVLLSKLYRLLRIIHKGTKQIIDGHSVVNVNEEIGICSFLKYIIIPSDRQNTVTKFELAHEKNHLAQFHSIDIIAVWIYQSIFWFNPIVYLYRTRLLEVHEFLADRGAIQITGKSSYQEYILGVVSQRLQPQLVNNFKSIIKTRLIMMNSKSKPTKWSYLIAFAVFFSTVLLFSCHSKKAAKYIMTDRGFVEVITETVSDTTIVIDYDTFHETVNITNKEVHYIVDTVVVIDYDTNKEVVSIVKSFLLPEDMKNVKNSKN